MFWKRTAKIVFGLVLVVTSLLVGIYFSPYSKLTPLTFFKNPTEKLPEIFPQTSVKRLKHQDGTIMETGIKRGQNNERYRTVEVSGFVKATYESNNFFFVALVVPTGQTKTDNPGTVTINLGGSLGDVGAYFPFNNVIGKQRKWTTVKVGEIKDKFRVGNQILVEVFSWMDTHGACEHPGCDEAKIIYNVHKKDNSGLDNLVFGKTTIEPASLGFFDGLIIGPAVSLITEQ